MGLKEKQNESQKTVDTVVGTAVDTFVEHGLPWMGRKAVEMGRYGESEALRNKKLQRKAVNYGINIIGDEILLNFGVKFQR